MSCLLLIASYKQFNIYTINVRMIVGTFIVKWALEYLEWSYGGWTKERKHEQANKGFRSLGCGVRPCLSRGAVYIAPCDSLLSFSLRVLNLTSICRFAMVHFCPFWSDWIRIFTHLGWWHIKLIYKKINFFPNVVNSRIKFFIFTKQTCFS